MTDTTQPQERDVERELLQEAIIRMRYAKDGTFYISAKQARLVEAEITRLRTQPSPREVALEKALREAGDVLERSATVHREAHQFGFAQAISRAVIEVRTALSPAQKREPPRIHSAGEKRT